MQRRNPYDEVPYRGRIHPVTAPLHLALSSLCHAGPAPPIDRYRVMELGCGDGANLIPLAFYSPDCDFIGVDSSLRQIRSARETVDALELTNIRFEQQDVRDLDPNGYGSFDYILAHGLFSWIPDDARRAVLFFCQTHLSSTGLAYICYNAMPGWAIRGLLRDILLRSQRIRETPIDGQAEAALALIRELHEDLPSREYAFGDLLAREFEYLESATPFYIQHEYLAEENHPFWLRDFVNLAAEFGLDYVANAQFCKPDGRLPQGLPQKLALRPLNRVEQEERIDLLCQRTLHASILCRKDAPRRQVTRRQLLDEVFIACDLSASSDPFQLADGVVEAFEGSSRVEITLEEPITKAAVLILSAAWPMGLTFETVLNRAEQMLKENGFPLQNDGRETLAEEISELLSLGEITWRLKEPISMAALSRRPHAHALAKFEAAKNHVLTTPHHLSLPLEPAALALIRRNDTESTGRSMDTADRHTLEMLMKWGLVR
jgi:SAM-dependent methyltransferase